MATEAQVETMLALMREQMEHLKTLRDENAQLRHAAPTAGKTKIPDRPTINANIDEREWELFKDTWKRYKAMAKITTAAETQMELCAACSPDVNKLLFEFVGPDSLATSTEEQLLAHIKTIAVKGTHKEVHRMNFGKMKQMDGEKITQFVARLKSQASLCQFTVTCTSHNPATQVSYADEMVTQQLIAGLGNQQHQSRILAEASTLTTLAQKIARLQCLESTEESTSQMRTTPSTYSRVEAAHQSTYRSLNKHQRRQATRPAITAPRMTPCIGCGRTSHGTDRSMSRRDCPAFNKVCASCGITGHFQAVCKKSRRATQSRSNAVEEPADEPNIDPEGHNDTSFAFATQDFRLAPNTNGQFI